MTQALEKYNNIFFNIFNVEESEFRSFEYRKTPEWNSMAQIAIVSAIEDIFGVDFDMDDIFSLTSYEKGKEILEKKFGITI